MTIPAEAVQRSVSIVTGALANAEHGRVFPALLIVTRFALDAFGPVLRPRLRGAKHEGDVPDYALIELGRHAALFDRQDAVRAPRLDLTVPHLIGVGVAFVRHRPRSVSLDEELPAVRQIAQPALKLFGAHAWRAYCGSM